MKKAFEMNSWGLGNVHFNPETAGWPSFSFYLHMFVQQFQFYFGQLMGDYSDQGDFFLQKVTWSPLAVWARAVGVIAAAIIVGVGTRLGYRLAGFPGGILSGLILLSSPLLTRFTHLITPDILVFLFAGLALNSLVNIVDRGSRTDYLLAGLWIGLGISSKYTPVLLLPCVFLAHYVRQKNTTRISLGRTLIGLKPWQAVIVSLGVFFLSSPFVFFDLPSLTGDVNFQISHLTKGHFGHSSHGPGWIFYIKNVLGPGLGWPAFILGITGLIFSAYRRGGKWWVILSVFLVFYLPLALLQTRFERYMLPALLPLALGVGGLWTIAEPWLRSRGKKFLSFSFILLALILVFPPAKTTWQFLDQQGKPGTLQLAKQWLLAQKTGPGPYLIMEHYTPVLPRAFDLSSRLNDPVMASLSKAQQAVWLDVDPVKIVYFPMYSTLGGDSGFFYDLRHFSGFDFIVTSSRVRGRYENDPQQYPKQNHFYDELDRLLRKPIIFAPENQRRGPEIRIYSLGDDERRKLTNLRPPLEAGDFVSARKKVASAHLHGFTRSIAKLAYERELFGQAANYYGFLNVIQDKGNQVSGLRAIALDLVNRERWDKALPLLQQWRDSDPLNPEPLALLGVREMKSGNINDARVLLGESFDLAGNQLQYAALKKRIIQLQAEVEALEYQVEP